MAQDAQSVQDQNARQRLLESATALFAQKGYAAASVGEIVARAGVSRPVLYYYFGSKEGLFQAILEEAAQLQEALLSQAGRHGGPVLERLIYLCQMIHAEVVEQPHLFRLLHVLAFGPPQGSPQFDLEAFHWRMVEAMKNMVAQGQARGELRADNPEEMTFLILSVLSFCLDLDLCYPARADASRVGRLLRLAFRGIAPGEE